MSNGVSGNAPSPRLCHVKKWSDFNGYGFNLHAEKGKAGQFVGKVDPGSPAESAGLKESDRIIEVNGTNIGNENHSQVVQRIKAVPNETKLLVVDAVTDDYFKEQKIVVRGDMPYVESFECPDEKGGEVIRKSPDTASDKQDEPHEASTPAKPEPEIQEEDEDDYTMDIDFSDFDDDEAAAPVVAAVAVAATEEDGPVPRQCHMVIWPDFQGYGFNLHAEKGKPGQFIGKVDPGSPAEAAGLKQGDRIVEVNGQFIGEDNHGQVVQKIKSDATRTTMLVVDEDAENYYRAKGARVSSSMSNTNNIHCPASKAEYTAAATAAAKPDPTPAPAAAAAAVVVATTNYAPAPAATESDSAPAPRLCHLKSWPDYKGYGFNLHAEKEKGHGQYIGKVDAGSPAEAADLRGGDKIIEVNGQNVASEDHRNVVANIKSDSAQVRLLVVDQAAFEYYKARDVAVHAGLSSVRTVVCPDQQGGLANGSSSTIVTKVEQEEHKAEVISSQFQNGVEYNENEVKQDEAPEVDVNENEPVKRAEPEGDANGSAAAAAAVALSEGDEAAAAIEDSIREAEQEVKKKEEEEEEEKTKKKKQEVAASAAAAKQKMEEELDELQDYAVVERREPKADAPAVYDDTIVSNADDIYDDITVQDSSTAAEVVSSATTEAIYDEPQSVAAAAAAVPIPVSPSSPQPVTVGGIEFSGSAKEARERLSKRSSRKHEVKKTEGVSMRDKFELFQKL